MLDDRKTQNPLLADLTPDGPAPAASEPPAPAPTPASSEPFDLEGTRKKLSDAYRARFNKDIRVKSYGQDDYHARRGMNHTGKMDVGMGRETPEEREFIADWLRTNKIPHKIFTRAIPEKHISGPHAHIGSGNGEVDFQPYSPAPKLKVPPLTPASAPVSASAIAQESASTPESGNPLLADLKVSPAEPVSSERALSPSNRSEER